MTTPTPMDHRRRSALVNAFVAVAAVATVGMLVNSWIVVWLCIPAFATVMFLQGALTHKDTWDRAALLAVAAFCLGLFVLFFAVVFTESSDATLWGLPLSMALVVYVIWPYTAIGAGVLYAFVFEKSLKNDVVSING